MFHYGKQWSDKATQEQLIDPTSTYIGDTKIIVRSEELKKKKMSGTYKFRTIGTCKGVAPIENYSNHFTDVTGLTEHHAYHYFDWSDGIWRTEYIMLIVKGK
tara:strand:- start:3477 stop:3782 length:306 start_codon:yes stop_codon:yes gene_type:complete